jgi:hypothetical protein
MNVRPSFPFRTNDIWLLSNGTAKPAPSQDLDHEISNPSLAYKVFRQKVLQATTLLTEHKLPEARIKILSAMRDGEKYLKDASQTDHCSKELTDITSQLLMCNYTLTCIYHQLNNLSATQLQAITTINKLQNHLNLTPTNKKFAKDFVIDPSNDTIVMTLLHTYMLLLQTYWEQVEIHIERDQPSMTEKYLLQFQSYAPLGLQLLMFILDYNNPELDSDHVVFINLSFMHQTLGLILHYRKQQPHEQLDHLKKALYYAVEHATHCGFGSEELISAAQNIHQLCVDLVKVTKELRSDFPEIELPEVGSFLPDHFKQIYFLMLITNLHPEIHTPCDILLPKLDKNFIDNLLAFISRLSDQLLPFVLNLFVEFFKNENDTQTTALQVFCATDDNYHALKKYIDLKILDYNTRIKIAQWYAQGDYKRVITECHAELKIFRWTQQKHFLQAYSAIATAAKSLTNHKHHVTTKSFSYVTVELSYIVASEPPQHNFQYYIWLSFYAFLDKQYRVALQTAKFAKTAFDKNLECRNGHNSACNSFLINILIANSHLELGGKANLIEALEYYRYAQRHDAANQYLQQSIVRTQDALRLLKQAEHKPVLELAKPKTREDNDTIIENFVEDIIKKSIDLNADKDLLAANYQPLIAALKVLHATKTNGTLKIFTACLQAQLNLKQIENNYSLFLTPALILKLLTHTSATPAGMLPENYISEIHTIFKDKIIAQSTPKVTTPANPLPEITGPVDKFYLHNINQQLQSLNLKLQKIFQDPTITWRMDNSLEQALLELGLHTEKTSARTRKKLIKDAAIAHYELKTQLELFEKLPITTQKSVDNLLRCITDFSTSLALATQTLTLKNNHFQATHRFSAMLNIAEVDEIDDLIKQRALLSLFFKIMTLLKKQKSLTDMTQKSSKVFLSDLYYAIDHLLISNPCEDISATLSDLNLLLLQQFNAPQQSVNICPQTDFLNSILDFSPTQLTTKSLLRRIRAHEVVMEYLLLQSHHYRKTNFNYFYEALSFTAKLLAFYDTALRELQPNTSPMSTRFSLYLELAQQEFHPDLTSLIDKLVAAHNIVKVGNLESSIKVLAQRGFWRPSSPSLGLVTNSVELENGLKI